MVSHFLSFAQAFWIALTTFVSGTAWLAWLVLCSASGKSKFRTGQPFSVLRKRPPCFWISCRNDFRDFLVVSSLLFARLPVTSFRKSLFPG